MKQLGYSKQDAKYKNKQELVTNSYNNQEQATSRISIKNQYNQAICNSKQQYKQHKWNQNQVLS